MAVARKIASLLKAIVADHGGNVLAIGAACVLPVMAVVGGAVDMSRNYMVQTRLQQACDAGVLAGRKAVGAGTYNTAAAAQATKMFNANFPVSYAGSNSLSFVPSSPDNGTTVKGVASTTVPSMVMQVFGYNNTKLRADCAATFQITNTDVTMVLDVTGSMNDPISDGAGGTTTRIAALRAAMKNFYTTMAAASANTTARIRYGLVPYSQTVNAGRLVMAQNPDYIVGGNASDTILMQTRRPVFESSETTIETLGSVDAYECYYQFSRNQGISGWWQPADWGYNVGQNVSKSGDATGTYSFQFHSWNGSTNTPNTNLRGSNYWRTCQRKATRTTITYDRNAPGARFLRYEYAAVDTPINAYYRTLSDSSTAIRPSDATARYDRWAGCLREPDTTAATSFTYDAVSKRITPTSAVDLDIDRVPSTPGERWKPLWQEALFHRDGTPGVVTNTDPNTTYGATWTGCPQQAQLLSVMTKTAFDTYADSLFAAGSTYHDIGILWGARIASPNGIFSSNAAAAAPNNGFISRNMIFMTDGTMSTVVWSASSAGIEWNDHNIVQWNGAANDWQGIQNQQGLNHTSRFLALCEAVKAKSIRLWVVAFATDLDANLTKCASPNSAFVSTNAAGLNENFERIAKSMSDLRITE